MFLACPKSDIIDCNDELHTLMQAQRILIKYDMRTKPDWQMSMNEMQKKGRMHRNSND